MVFDLDGTLVDSEPLYRVVDEEFLRAKGIQLSQTDWHDAVGLGGPAFVDLLRERYGLRTTVDEFVAEKDRLYLDYARGRTRAFPRVVALLRYLYVAGYPLAVATNSRRDVMEAVLADAGIECFFTATVAADDVDRPKPAPDLFAEAARRLGVDQQSCLVFDDSLYGVRGAREAGMRVIGLPDATYASGRAEGFDAATLVIDGGPRAIDPAAIIGMFELYGPGRSKATTGIVSLDDRCISRFRSVVYEGARGRDAAMPWRHTDDAYRILVSEFMLQQTQVARVIPKYDRFVDRFPDVRSLADADLQSVLDLWQGLGYNRRGKYLRDAAVALRDWYDCRVPESPQALQTLPGVGEYTAAAIAAFAFRKPVVVLETNIRRAILYHFFPTASNVHDHDVRGIIEYTIDRDDPRRWYYALMDYGSLLSAGVTNPNRNSRHYTRQRSFAGSVRQVRGQIVAALVGHGTMSVESLERAIGPTDSRFAPALEGLERDGIIGRSGGRVSMKE